MQGDRIDHTPIGGVTACPACRDKGCPVDGCTYTHPGAACTATGCPGRATGSIRDQMRDKAQKEAAAARATANGRPGPGCQICGQTTACKRYSPDHCDGVAVPADARATEPDCVAYPGYQGAACGVACACHDEAINGGTEAADARATDSPNRAGLRTRTHLQNEEGN